MPVQEKFQAVSQFDLENFTKTYSSKLLDKFNQILEQEKKLTLLKADYIKLQESYGKQYKLAIVRKFMDLWIASGKFPRDDELTRVIFHLSGQDWSEIGLEVSEKAPQTKLTLINGYYFCFKYFNERIGEWTELKP